MTSTLQYKHVTILWKMAGQVVKECWTQVLRIALHTSDFLSFPPAKMTALEVKLQIIIRWWANCFVKTFQCIASLRSFGFIILPCNLKAVNIYFLLVRAFGIIGGGAVINTGPSNGGRPILPGIGNLTPIENNLSC